ncbi:UbiA family prenyltransferase [Streptomyces sp. NPDC060184]|uniref:UbiA family prenyltransferase n=1 Tax=Streptomyces sp. NPDC060184 TaxID=3347064 RepID=UPI00364ABA0B
MSTTTAPAVIDVRTSGSPLRILGLSLREARPVVQMVFLMRFGAGLLLAQPHLRNLHAGAAAGAVSWFCVTAGAYLLNGIMDLPEDRGNGSRRPLASGLLRVRTAWLVTVLLDAAGLVLCWDDPGRLGYALVMLMAGAVYSVPPFAAKRRSLPAGAVVTVMGLATFGAGCHAAGGAWDLRLGLVALSLSLWMGLVGATAKDLGDLAGDRAAGRRTMAVVHGLSAARRFTAFCALAIGSASTFAAAEWDHPLTYGGSVVLCGAIAVALLCLRSAGWPERAPYRAFMITQYLATLVFGCATLAG